MRLVFAISVGLVLYTYVVYPVLLLALAGLRQFADDLRYGLGRRNRRTRLATDTEPYVSIVFAAHNEEAVIDQKMLNCLGIDYPPTRLEILIGCDACTDTSARRARAAGLPNASVYEFGTRSGKPAVLNRLVPLAKGEIVVFCDANTEFAPGTVRSLVRHFSKPDVGCVCGELRLRPVAGKPSGEHLYWRYETLLKFLESRLNMLVGANGGVMAIRKGLFMPIPPDGIVEDFLIALNILASGHRVVYDPEAVAWEDVALDAGQEFRRRVRIGAGNFHALRYSWRLLIPTAGPIALAYWSHKVCRWVVPVALCAAQIAALSLANERWYAVSAALLASVPALAFAGYRLSGPGRSWMPLSTAYHFVSMNLALLLGLLRFLRGTQSIVWSPTPRSPLPVASLKDGAVAVTNQPPALDGEGRVASGRVKTGGAGAV